jgi:hypothetical protein
VSRGVDSDGAASRKPPCFPTIFLQTCSLDDFPSLKPWQKKKKKRKMVVKDWNIVWW